MRQNYPIPVLSPSYPAKQPGGGRSRSLSQTIPVFERYICKNVIYILHLQHVIQRGSNLQNDKNNDR